MKFRISQIAPPNPEQIGEGGPTLPPVQEEEHREEGTPRGYVRMAVMDGKTITHRICALDACNKPLVNYKNGRFCEDHLNLIGICGIIPCGHDPNGPRPAAPTLRVQDQLPNLQDLPGGQVVHTFRAKSTYCLQTIQWACGIPVGWGKCYRSESSPQVLAILDKIWEDNDELRPSFIAYDDACDLLRHIVTQNANSHWLKSTKFVVDAWHYIGHRSTDMLCRIWCNPAPTNGSQPDLILTQTSDDGEIHTVRAFNTETAEHLNSWLDGFDSQLRQMSVVNYDFFVHVLMLIYKESVEEKIIKKGLDLTEEFWEED
ncbi:hypothetical protein GALMADRAFT_65875 [Galerina marginata CBS 339.88]|uniref:CxC6 like cysteine cluster associated with KDZ domain-containing protein n=1 Tax=Galerina marginata (strain CBS 339.88) TaxID=685588 RepID=A0A067TFU5_GALM3|nr:hypothetical protein GALMADRAFT_65875 [Galerina marginata CBS 339.88]